MGRRLAALSLCLAFMSCAPVASAGAVWFEAQAAQELSPLMTLAGHVGLLESNALGEFLVPMVTATPGQSAPDCWAQYSVVVPKAGSYWLWGRVRFPAGDGESFRIVATSAAGSSAELLLAAGQDPRHWHWVRGGRLALSAGRSQLRIYPHRASATTFGPLRWRQAELTQTPRLNLVCLVDNPGFVPTDAAAPGRSPPAPTPEPRVVPARFRPSSDSNEPVNNRNRVPDWMRCPRWFTKDTWRDELRHRQPGDIAALVREVAANGGETLRLSCFWGGEAYFQSQVAPHAPELGRLDYLSEAMTAARSAGVKVVAYLNPNALCLDHPLFSECVIRGADGRPNLRPAYGAGWRPAAAYACINHPRYRQFLRGVLTEIFTRYGPAGLYVDGLTPHLCFCEYCRAKWRGLFGLEMPLAKLDRWPAAWAVWGEFGRDPQPVGDVENDADARRLTELMYRSLVEATDEIRHAVKQAKPEAVTLFHSHPKPGNEDDYDGTLTEVYAPQPWVHTAWRSGELAGYSAVYRVPVLFNVYPHRHFTAAEARYHALQGLANGAYPNFWSAAGMKPVFDFLGRQADYYDFATAAPVRFLAFPRDLQESVTQRLAPVGDGVRYAPGNRFLAPYVGAYAALMRAGLPVVTLHRPHFETELAGFQVLFLANVALLSDAQADAVRQFVGAGGGLIASHETSLFDEKGRQRADFALADVLGAHYQVTRPPAERRVIFAPGHALTAGLAADTSLRHGDPIVAATPSGSDCLASFTTGEPALLIHRYGRGRVVYLPGRFDAHQCYTLLPEVERLLANAVRWVAPEGLPVEIDAPGAVGVTLFHQPRRLVVHLVNHQRDAQFRSDSVTPLNPVSLRLAVPAEAAHPKVRGLWANRTLASRLEGRTLRVEVGSLDEYEAVAVDW